MEKITDIERLEKIAIPDFETKISYTTYEMTDKLDVMQVNVGNICNLACKHCHVDASPSQKNQMSKEVMDAILIVSREQNIKTIDITGGAPEMNENFEYFVKKACEIAKKVIVRTNLTILLEEKYVHLIKFYADNKINVVCSLPFYEKEKTDRVRGAGVFDKSIEALKKLNDVGYGKDEDKTLDLVYNPSGAFFPPSQSSMESLYKQKLYDSHGIVFNNLFTITNNPVGRFADFLERTDNYNSYFDKLYQNYNEATIPNLMCRFQLSVDYNGNVYDCDFNQAIGLKIDGEKTIFDFVSKKYEKRKIKFARHCYACTAGAGSSCGGEVG